MSTVPEKVKEIVVEQLGISPEQVSNDSSVFEIAEVSDFDIYV